MQRTIHHNPTHLGALIMRSYFSARVRVALCLGLLFLTTPSIAHAQNVAAVFAASDQTPPPAQSVQERRFFKDILIDQKEIWTSPFHMNRGDAKWAVPALVGTAAFIASDREINEEVPKTGASVDVSNAISYIGSGYAVFGAAGATYLIGRAAHNERARATGLLGIEALIDETIVVQALKQITNRERPNKPNGNSDFYDGGTGFPSGHAAASWTLATVFAEQYSDHKYVPWVAYGLASAVCVARVTAVKHSASDVFVGGIIGYLIGHHVAKRGSADVKKTTISILPFAERHTHSMGLTGTITF